MVVFYIHTYVHAGMCDNLTAGKTVNTHAAYVSAAVGNRQKINI